MHNTVRILGLSKVAWIIIAGAAIITIAMGVRNTFGIFMQPLSAEHGVSITMLSFAVALQNLIWGLAQPVTGAISDRQGAGRVIVFGGLLYGLGLIIAISFADPIMIIFGAGILIGIAQSCTTFAVVLGVVGRNVEEKRRPMALGIASAGGSFGQIAIVPLAQGLITYDSLEFSILAMAALAFVLMPLAIPMVGKPSEAAAAAAPRPGAGIVRRPKGRGRQFRIYSSDPWIFHLWLPSCLYRRAFARLLVELRFADTHRHSRTLAATALATVGIFNMIGTYFHGLLGTRFLMKNLLAWNYTLRAVFILTFFLAPKSEFSVLAFAVAMGTLWLGTVPLTSGVIAKMFGPANLGMLFGVCFLSHQIGSFLGIWIGGYIFDFTGNYDMIWILTALAGFIAAALNWPIKERAIEQPA